MALCLPGQCFASYQAYKFIRSILWIVYQCLLLGRLPGCGLSSRGIEIAGPFAGQMFAEWGAEVIWIENVAWADTIRVQPNYPQLSRRNLHALSLNIFKDEGREAFLKLMETTDIFH
ncbi:crotonobetainyl-CoA:carnitine CoA-transferase [Citrobacter amalonaticus]|nr:crotonobetainyl-CoA:carnitine CoA-transferase [Citrobacter amalonaticus]